MVAPIKIRIDNGGDSAFELKGGDLALLGNEVSVGEEANAAAGRSARERPIGIWVEVQGRNVFPIDLDEFTDPFLRGGDAKLGQSKIENVASGAAFEEPLSAKTKTLHVVSSLEPSGNSLETAPNVGRFGEEGIVQVKHNNRTNG